MPKEKPLASDETRMVRYDQLSPQGKARFDADAKQRFAAAKKAAEDGDTFGQRASDTIAKVLYASPFNQRANDDIGEVTKAAAAREARRQRALAEARIDAETPAKPRRLLADVVPHKVTDEPMFRKGGSVKGWGKARRARACKVR